MRRQRTPWPKAESGSESYVRSPGPSPIAPSTTTLSTAERLQWNFNRFLALEIGHSYSDQSSSDAQVLVTRYNSYGFNLHWSILGRAEARR